MKNKLLLIMAISLVITSCQIHYRDLTPPNQPNWQNSFDFTTLENVDVWPYLTPEDNLLYTTSTKNKLSDYAENLGYHFYLEIKPDNGISNIKPTIIINGERYDMENQDGTGGGLWFHRELAQTTCNIEDYAYYYEIRYKRWGYSDVQIAKLYSEETPAHSTIQLENIISLVPQGMKPVSDPGYSMKTNFPSGSKQVVKILLNNRTNKDIYCTEASIAEDFENGYPGCGNEFRITSHPSYTYPSPIQCGTYVPFEIEWSPLYYSSASDVPAEKSKSIIKLWIYYKYKQDDGTWTTDSKIVNIYGLYQ